MTTPTWFHGTLHFLAQGFHFHGHPFQTAITFVFLLGIAGALISLVGDGVQAVIKFYRKFFVDAQVISKQDWFDHQRQLGEAKSNAATAASSASRAEALASAASTKAQQTNSDTAASVQDLGNRITALDALVRRIEQTPVNNQAALEVSNALDAIRDELHGIQERLNGLELGAELSDVQVAALSMLVPTPTPRKAKKTKKRR